MATFLFTTLPSNDLGLLTRSLPVARELAALGHRAVFCSPGRAPRRLIADAGFESRLPDDPLYNLSDASNLRRLLRPDRWRSVPVAFRVLRTMMRSGTAEVWTVDHAFAMLGLGDAHWVRAGVDSLVRLIADVRPDAVVDFWNPLACIAARATGTPLATIIQADIHPDSRGFIWWRDPPADVPTPVPGLNRALAGLGLPPIARAAELLLGDLTLAVGIPEIDPLPPGATVKHVGPILWQQPGSTLPDWVTRNDPERPLVWIYSGNPAYAPGASTPFDSRVVLEACIDALRTEPVRVVLTTGHQPLPRRFRRLPRNFRHEPYLPGLALARHSAVLVHHGGYGSCQTGLWAGRPAVVIPTFSERESNARRLADAGAGLVVLPESDPRGMHKRVRAEAVRTAVRSALHDPAYAQEAARLGRALRAAGGARLAARLIAGVSAPTPC